jgi:hypothetical protein
MPAYVQVEVTDDPGGPGVLIEVDAPEGMVDVGRGERVVTRAGESLEAMADRVRPMVDGMVRSFREAVDAPDEVRVTFGMTLSSEADVIISRASAAANFQVELTWRRDDGPGPRARPSGQGADG